MNVERGALGNRASRCSFDLGSDRRGRGARRASRHQSSGRRAARQICRRAPTYRKVIRPELPISSSRALRTRCPSDRGLRRREQRLAQKMSRSKGWAGISWGGGQQAAGLRGAGRRRERSTNMGLRSADPWRSVAASTSNQLQGAHQRPARDPVSSGGRQRPSSSEPTSLPPARESPSGRRRRTPRRRRARLRRVENNGSLAWSDGKRRPVLMIRASRVGAQTSSRDVRAHQAGALPRLAMISHAIGGRAVLIAPRTSALRARRRAHAHPQQ